ncbi:glycosyltransferase family 4 protein [Dyadobacter sp. CY261]|uniref:glycosyltransferase family 4 protein n=1 Tax=Dyadobacter sp. CY261 TaxID=2907203 RepID=UPI001F443F36|nr:glycosyltransferase family 4 protein [Dyadobacter sp. CY261]MCF0074496.1 glycosyltransferase family 4 protein [Dyadobacter sp. CY261]
MESKKRVTYILHDIAVGGVEVAFISALPALHKKYHLQVIVLGTVNDSMVAHLSAEEKQVFTAFDYPLFLYPVILPKILRKVSEHRPDLLICSLWRASMVGTLVKLGNSRVKFYSFNHSTRFPHFFSSFFTRMAAKTADVILTDGIATSNFVQEKLRPKAPVKIVSFLTQKAPEKITSNIPKPDESVRFMFLGRINKVKNLPLMVSVIETLRGMSIPATLDIYGRNDGDGQEAIERISQANLQEHIRFMGEVPSSQRSDLFHRYHFYLQLSSFEGMAMSVAEAMQHGLVCVVSPVGEIVHYARDMESAIFINIFDEAVWKNDIGKISEVIANPNTYLRISTKCHKNFLSREEYKDSLIEQLEA